MRVTSSPSLSRPPARTGRRSGAGTNIHQRSRCTACLSTYATSQVFFSFLWALRRRKYSTDANPFYLQSLSCTRCAATLQHSANGTTTWNNRIIYSADFKPCQDGGAGYTKTVIGAPALSLVWMGAPATGKQQQYRRDAERTAERQREALTEVETPFLRPCCSLCSLTNFDYYHWLGRWVAHLTAAFRGCWNDERNKFLVRITTARGLAALTKMVGLHRTHAQPMS